MRPKLTINKKGELFEIGQRVKVPEPIKGDSYKFSLTGEISDFKFKDVIIEDDNGDLHKVHVDRLENIK
jgi:hypothetical protein